MKDIILAGGCFWGLEDLISKLDGVLETQVGYAGGEYDNPVYSDVKTGMTGHAEAVKISYDESVISLKDILHFFFRIHDPTTLDRQGNDVGTQYRSLMIVNTPEENQLALDVIEEVNILGRFQAPVVTQILIEGKYYPAEEYHQKYLKKFPNGYTCHFIRK